MAYGDPTNEASLAAAFSVAESVGFKLFFSFDYAGNGALPKEVVISYITKYAASSAYFQHGGQPFVSTFEGPNNANDWVDIKGQTGCFFIPDWSSVGAKAAMAKGVADGLFSWAAWAWGGQEMNTYVDASYRDYLKGLPYMMPVSPWFYTNLPGYNKNWLWRSDNLWYDRWQEVWYLQPEFVQIISWNDYGESHYIGPVYEKSMAAFDIGRAPFNYVENMPHDGWRALLPFVIDMYKSNTTVIVNEGLVTWFRPQPRAACNDGNTTVNTVSQLQIESLPTELVEDHVFFSALLGRNADVSVTVGGVVVSGVKWLHTPDGGAGMYHGSVAYPNTGDVVVTVSREGEMVAQVSGGSITTTCNDGYENWNAWVGSDVSPALDLKIPRPIGTDVCVEGTGVGNFAGLCEFACNYGYCPVGACYCTMVGEQRTLPNATGITGYPAAGEDANYSGLCSFTCNYGYCPEGACATVSSPLTIPSSSPFTPSACVAGTGEGNLGGLCSYACNFGYCPIHSCTCTAEGVLVDAPAANSSLTGVPVSTVDYNQYHGLCDFACSRGYCPDGACELRSTLDPSTGSTGHDSSSSSSTSNISNDTIAFVGSGIWEDPYADCPFPCTIIFPDTTLGSPTIIYPPPYTTTLQVEWEGSSVTTQTDGEVSTGTTTTRVAESTTIDIPPITGWGFWPVVVNGPTDSPITVHPTPRLPPSTVIIADDPNPLGQSSVTHASRPRTVIIPPYPWDTRPYGKDDSDDNLIVPKPPAITVGDGPVSPKCTNDCGKLCSDRFCGCTWACRGTGFTYSDVDTDDDNNSGSTTDNGGSSPSKGSNNNNNSDGDDDDDDDDEDDGGIDFGWGGIDINGNSPDPNANNEDSNK
ncbi:hypothetical protein BO99DRAFT_316686, partial [Aspergillus violaceofuscus CBS 115571]